MVYRERWGFPWAMSVSGRVLISTFNRLYCILRMTISRFMECFRTAPWLSVWIMMSLALQTTSIQTCFFYIMRKRMYVYIYTYIFEQTNFCISVLSCCQGYVYCPFIGQSWCLCVRSHTLGTWGTWNGHYWLCRLVDLYVYLSCGQQLVHGVPGHLVVMASTPRPSIHTTLLGCPTKLVNGL